MQLLQFLTISSVCVLALLLASAFTSSSTRIPERYGSSQEKERDRQLNTPHADKLPYKDVSNELMQLCEFIRDNDTFEDMQDALLTSNFHLHSYVDYPVAGTQGAIVTNYDKGYVAVVFRASDDDELNDWITNFSMAQVDAEQLPGAPEGVKLHEGFQNAVISNNIAKVFGDEVMSLLDSDLTNVYVTGHSLGGALAHIMGVYLADNNPDYLFNVVNFGAPRVGNDDFKTWTEDSLTNLSVWRFVFRADIVPRIMHGYDHAGHLFQIWRKSSVLFYTQNGGGEYEGVPSSWHGGHNMNHHFLSKYKNFFENKAHKSKFWPTSFKVVRVVQCEWYQWWC